MFDLFGGPTTSQINEALTVQSVNYATIVTLLLEKGLATHEEISLARVKATHMVDQLRAKQQEQDDKEFDEQHPGMRKFIGRITGGSE